jgi:CxxC motif-containing protein (DUF1111 family)
MHEGNVYTIQDAIQRHGNQGAASRAAFNALSAGAQNDLVAFVQSL